jgi:translocator protein
MIESLKTGRLGGPARSTLALAGFLAASFAVSVVGSRVTAPETGPGGWLQTLELPFFYPPGWLFGVVWPVLYVLMAVAAWLVWRERGFSWARVPLVLYFLQLGLNLLWSVIFFGLRAPGLALLEIMVLGVAVALTVLAFRSVSRPAALLMLPYLAWVGFAAVLNAAIWWLN